MVARSRSSVIRKDVIEYGFWLVFSPDGSLRMARTKPSLGRDERAMACSATLPVSLFSTPELRANISIGHDVRPQKIDVQAASEALRKALGVDIDLRVHDGQGDDR